MYAKSHRNSLFHFHKSEKKDMDTEIQRLEYLAQKSDIPSRIIKENSGVFGDYLLSNLNDAIDKSYFPTALKQANITPVFKTEKILKVNHSPISILPNM